MTVHVATRCIKKTIYKTVSQLEGSFTCLSLVFGDVEATKIQIKMNSARRLLQYLVVT